MLYYIALLPCLLGIVSQPWVQAADNCPCGYKSKENIFTEVMETDFTLVPDLFKRKVGWDIQEWQRPPSAASPLGQISSRDNVRTSSTGLKMYVSPKNDSMVVRSEIATTRTDMGFGSYRVGLLTTATRGTCGAFFWVCVYLATAFHSLLLTLNPVSE
jgi:hypothetical protein